MTGVRLGSVGKSRADSSCGPNVNNRSDRLITQECSRHLSSTTLPEYKKQPIVQTLSHFKIVLATVLLVLFLFCVMMRFTFFAIVENDLVFMERNSTGMTPLNSLRNKTSAVFPHVPGMKRRLPKCIIIGVRKCGTRALLEFLNLHPQIRIAEQEIHFFDTTENYKNGLEWYRKKMPYTYADQITIEKSPAYFITHHVPTRISHMNKHVKIVMIVREPTTRVISDYTQIYANHLARNRSYQSFEDAVINWSTGHVNLKFKPIRTSIYQHHMTRWLRVFRKEQVHVVNGDDLVQNPIHELQSVEKFLGLEHRISKKQLFFNKTRGFYCMINGNQEHCLGLSKGRKHPHVQPQVRQKLEKFFQPHNEKFFSMIGRSFDWP